MLTEPPPDLGLQDDDEDSDPRSPAPEATAPPMDSNDVKLDEQDQRLVTVMEVALRRVFAHDGDAFSQLTHQRQPRRRVPKGDPDLDREKAGDDSRTRNQYLVSSSDADVDS